jgi:hypothetical protein
LKIKLDFDDMDLTKKKKEIGQEITFWRWHKFHNIREFFKKEKGGSISGPAGFLTSWQICGKKVP